MGAFARFWEWLTARLTDYVSAHVATTAAAIEPAAVSLAVIYVMVWGVMHLRGAIQEPVIAGALRIARLAVVFGVGLQLWLYNAALVNTFMDAPVELAAALAGAADPVGTIDAVWEQGGSVAATLWEKGGVLSGDFGFYVAGAVVYTLVGAVCVYALFLMALARVAVALLLAIGPVFIVMLLFESTQRFFEAWIAQLANYALVGVLAVLTASLMLTVVEAYATQAAERGSAILTVDALDMLLMAGLVLLLLRQVMPIAARLGGGVALTSFGVASAVLGRGSHLSGTLGRRVGGGLVASMAERVAVGAAAWRAATSVATLAPPGSSGAVGPGRVMPAWRPVRGG